MKQSIIIFALLIANSLFGMEPVNLTEDAGEIPLGLYLEILEDKGGKLTLDDINKPEMENLWGRSKTQFPNFGFTKSVYWARFKTQSHSKKDFYLEIGYPLMDKIDFYALSNDGNVVHKKTGDLLPFKQRDLQYKNFLFILTSNDNIETSYYLRFESESSMQLSMTIWSPTVFAEKKITEMIGVGIFFGIMIVMVLYNLFIWISVRDNSYIYYVCYILFSTLFVLNYQGLTFQFFFFDSPILFNRIYPVFHFLAPLFMILFTSNFLHIKENLGFLYKIYNFLIIELALGIIATFFITYRLGTVIGILSAIISCVWMLSVGIIMAKRRYRPAMFYLIAWNIFLLGLILFALKALGVIPKNIFTEHSILFGSALEVILLSLGLADRINNLKMQNEIAQARALEAERRSSKVKDAFLANLSHELNTPLSIVYAFSEMLTRGKDYPEKVKKYSAEIYESAKKLNNYVSDLLLITDIESNLQLQKSVVDLNSLISKIIEQLKPLIDEREIKLEFVGTRGGTSLLEIKDESLQEFNCDPILLEKAIAAILKNAIVYNNIGGNVNVAVGYSYMRNPQQQCNPPQQQRDPQQHTHLQITIIDTGIGIAKEFHEKIFEKFFRIDSELTYTVSGVGVGLFIAKKIIDLHGGSIDVKSELGQGSEFTIRLPV